MVHALLTEPLQLPRPVMDEGRLPPPDFDGQQMLLIVRCSKEKNGDNPANNLVTQRTLLKSARDTASAPIPGLRWVTPAHGIYAFVASSVGTASMPELARFCRDMRRGDWHEIAVVVLLDVRRLGSGVVQPPS